MSETKTYVVFEPLATLLQVMDVADENGWTVAQHFRRGERQLEELVYELPDGETVVRGIDDHFVVVTLAVIIGPSSAKVEQKLRAGGRALSEATLWQWAKSKDHEERAFALRAFAATSEKMANPKVVDLYHDAVADQHPEVRKALIDSVGRAAWPELRPVVDKLAEAGDSDSMVLKRSYEQHFSRAT
jgi:hypothetical protein